MVKVDSPNDTNLKVRPIDKTIVKGALDDWDCNDLTVNPGGIFGDVRLLLSTDVYLGRMKATPLVEPADGSARVLCRVEAVNTTGRSLTVSLAAALEPANFPGKATSVERELVLPPGPSELDLWIDVEEPRLWWPWDLGEQHLYSLDLSVREGERILDRLSDRIGLRQVRTEPGSSAIHVNGTRVFCRGPNYVSEQLQSNMTRARYRTDVRMMREANMNMVRVYCVVEKEEFYDACDEQGILVYQDFPMRGRMSNSSDLVRRSGPQARDIVGQIYNHASIVLWCFGAQPGLRNFEKVGMAMAAAARREDPYRFVQQGASVWEWKLIKDKYDWPIDYHFFCGWFSPEFKHAPFHPREVLELPPEERASGASVEELKIKRKELLEFVSEYGTADSLTELDSLRKFIAEEDLWPVNWKIFTRRGLHSDRLRKWTGEPASLEQMIAASQDYQAFVLKYHTEFFRRHKFAPCNGALFFQFRDCWPGRDRPGGGLLRQEEEGLLRPAAGVQPDPRDDGLARPRRRAGRQHLPACGLRGQRLRRGVPLPDRHVAGARRRGRSARQRNHHHHRAPQQPAAGRRSHLGHSRRPRQLPGLTHRRTRQGILLE